MFSGHIGLCLHSGGGNAGIDLEARLLAKKGYESVACADGQRGPKELSPRRRPHSGIEIPPRFHPVVQQHSRWLLVQVSFVMYCMLPRSLVRTNTINTSIQNFTNKNTSNTEGKCTYDTSIQCNYNGGGNCQVAVERASDRSAIL